MVLAVFDARQIRERHFDWLGNVKGLTVYYTVYIRYAWVKVN